MTFGASRRAATVPGAIPVLVVVWAAAGIAGAPAAADRFVSRAAPVQPANQDARIVADFTKRVQQYADTHKKLESTLPTPPPKPTAAEVDTHERALARLVVQARGRAKAGDVFTDETRAYFRRQIAGSMSGPDGPQLRASIMDENPGRIQLRVNGRYPDGIPVSTMPPQVLAALPKLPEELEYRFIGDRLILMDVHARLVVDYIDDALPR
jgi:hypothetical protein